MLVSTALRDSFSVIQRKRMVVITDTEKNVLCTLIPLIGQLLLKPFSVKPHSLEIFLKDPSVHNYFRGDQVGLRGKIHIRRVDRSFGADRENGQSAVVFKHGGLNVIQIEISLLPAHSHEFAQVEFGFFHVFSVKLSVIHDNCRCSVDEFTNARKFAGYYAQPESEDSVYDHGNERLPRLLQFGCQFCGNRTDSDTRDVIKEIEL